MEAILEAIVVAKKRRLLAQSRQYLPWEVAELLTSPRENSFLEVFSGPGPNIVAEIKLSSPSKGKFISFSEIPRFVTLYERGGARAISVVTEEDHFQGGSQVLQEVVRLTHLPILRKDFVLEETQVYETRKLGAQALLLIARILSRERLGHFVDLCTMLGIVPVVEVHDERDLKKALEVQAPVVGINNRDLVTFRVSLEVTLRLLSSIPKDTVVLTESGIHTREDLEMFFERGVRNFLIGEALLTSPNPLGKLLEFRGEREIARC